MNINELLQLVLPPIPFVIAIVAIYYRRKKMTDQELQDEIQKIKTVPDNDFTRINPASGLPMIKGSCIDVSGNAYGEND